MGNGGRLLGRRAISGLESGDQGIRVPRCPCIRHISTIQRVHELARGHGVMFAVAVIVVNELVGL